MSIRTGRLVVAAAAVAALAVPVLPTSALAARDSSRITGVVTANDEPVREATVTLLAAGQTPGTATVVDTVTTDRRGGFTVTVPRTVRADAVLYATATGGRSGLHVLGPEVELAAVARRHPLRRHGRQRADHGGGRVTRSPSSPRTASLGGSAPGLPNAATDAAEHGRPERRER